MLILRVLLLALITLSVMSCSENSTEPESANFSVSFGIDRTLQKQNLEGVEIKHVKILVRSLKLTTGQGDDSNIKTDPFVVELDPNGNVNTVAVANMANNSYDKIKFEIHKLDSLATPPDPDFKDESGRYSVIVEGVYEGLDFTYRSNKSAKQIIQLDDPVSLEKDGILNVTLMVNPYAWFIKKGENLDPTQEGNENDIDNMIKDSIKRAFRDNNRDGIPD